MTRIGRDEHVFVAGQTGTGKSFLTELYLAGFDHVIKLDTKGEYWERKQKRQDAWMGLVEDRDFTVVFRLSELADAASAFPKVIYVPEYDELDQEFYDACFKFVFDRKNTTLWIDELMSIADSPLRYPIHLRALMTRGRSRNTAVWALTQRPMDIPTIVMANTTHFFVFDMQLPQDRKKVADATGVPEFLDKPGYRKFWYFKNGENHAVLSWLNVRQ